MTALPVALDYGLGPKEIDRIDSIEQLDAELDRITAEATDNDQPVLVNITSADDRVLTIGVGADFAILGWIDESDQERPYLHSVGDVDGGEPSEWWYGNQTSEYAPDSGITIAAARDAVREFIRTGDLPESVIWTD